MGTPKLPGAKTEIRSASWDEFALCRGMDPNLFFPPTTPARRQVKGTKHQKQINKAKAICAECPVRELCLQEALANQEPGIWGGLTEEERRVYGEREASPAEWQDKDVSY